MQGLWAAGRAWDFYPSEVKGSEQRRERPDLGAHRRPLVASERTGESPPPPQDQGRDCSGLMQVREMSRLRSGG